MVQKLQYGVLSKRHQILLQVIEAIELFAVTVKVQLAGREQIICRLRTRLYPPVNQLKTGQLRIARLWLTFNKSLDERLRLLRRTLL